MKKKTNENIIADCKKIFRQIKLNKISFDHKHSSLYKGVCLGIVVDICVSNRKASFSYLKDKERYWNLPAIISYLFEFGFDAQFMSDKGNPERLSDVFDYEYIYEFKSHHLIKAAEKALRTPEDWPRLTELLKIIDNQFLQYFKLGTERDLKIPKYRSEKYHYSSDELYNLCHIALAAGFIFRKQLCRYVDEAGQYILRITKPSPEHETCSKPLGRAYTVHGCNCTSPSRVRTG